MRALWSNRRVVVAAALAFAVVSSPGSTRGGVLGIPCDPGEFSASGFEPCAPCAAGTFIWFTGAIACEPVPEGAWSPPGSTGYEICECADEPLCTIDRCNAATGACTSHDPAPGCEPYQVEVSGTVTSVTGQLAGVFTLGTPFVASWIVDPAELDRSFVDWAGTYPYGIRHLHVRVGTGPSAIEGVSDQDSLYVESTPPRDSDYLDLIGRPTIEGFETPTFVLTLDDGDDPAITSDAIPPAFPSAASFASRDLRLVVRSGGSSASAVSDDFTLASPEPHSTLAGVGAAVALLGLRRMRGARYSL